MPGMGDPYEAAAERPFASVIIPVYNDAARLTSCLQALARQTYPKDRYEVIVVDNGSDTPVASVVAAAFPEAQVVSEPRPGSYAARNRGLALARGQIVALTDSDCLPIAEWLEEGIRALGHTTNCGLVGGRIDVGFENEANPTPVEIFSTIAARRQKQFIDADHFCETANLFTTSAVVKDVGPFEPALKSRGDVVFGQRIFAAGYRQVYAERAVVVHPAPRSLRALVRRTARLVGGKHDVSRLPSMPGAVTSTASTDPRNLPRLVSRIWTGVDVPLSVRWRLLGILALVQGVSVWERLRLLAGGTSRR
jgi:glycosyltransferase involved in cell wall biosynthesis